MKIIKLFIFLSFALILNACDRETLNHLPGADPWMDGNPADFKIFTDNAGTGPITMLNLLKFRETAFESEISGAESYVKYGELATPFVKKYDGEVIWSGKAFEHLIGDTNYDWDMVLLVKWPDRQNLLDLIDDEGYKAIAHHRKNGLERSMLIALDGR